MVDFEPISYYYIKLIGCKQSSCITFIYKLFIYKFTLGVLLITVTATLLLQVRYKRCQRHSNQFLSQSCPKMSKEVVETYWC